MAVEELNASELGTKEYWSSAYTKELENFNAYGDDGEVWFGEQNERRVAKWIAKHFAVSEPVIDIGCGNGHLLVRLASEHGFTCLTGLDYVEEALALAKALAAAQNVQDRIKFKVCDLLSGRSEVLARVDSQPHAVVVDKGTYDAICLMPNMNNDKRAAYTAAVKALIEGGTADCTERSREVTYEKARFVITSCNWTREELTTHFADDFEVVEELPTPTLSFGGQQGRTVTSLIFKAKRTCS